MKKTLTILLVICSLGVMGQKETTNIEIYPYSISTQNTTTITLPRGTVLITLDVLLEYQQECYNDSTKFEGALFRMFDGTEFIGTRPKPYEHVVSYVKDTVIWDHKSFELPEFITRIEIKYKINQP